MKEIIKGQTIFNSKGIEASYVQNLIDGKHLVAVPLYDAEGEEYDEIIQVWNKVLTVSPMPKLAEDLIKIQERIEINTKLRDEIDSEIYKKNRELQTIDSDILKRKNELKQHKSLENLDLFIQGKITHFIFIESGRYAIKEFNDMLELSDNYDRNKFKLLTLYGRSNGDLEWGISTYSDGSGSIKTVYPCLSKEDAEDKVIKIYHDLLSKLDSRIINNLFINTVKSALELGIALKQNIAEAYRQCEEEQRQENIIIVSKQIDELNKQLHIRQNRLIEFTKENL